MNNPLNAFQKMMVNFQLYRNSQYINTVKGLKNTEKSSNKKFIGFYPDTDIQVGDVLLIEGSPIKYFIIGIDTATYMGDIYQIMAFYQTTEPSSNSSNSTVYNINNPQNSIIGNQQQAILNNSNFNIDDFKQLIELYGANDKEKLYELSNQLETLLKSDTLSKSKLSKFSDLIAKHSWVALSIAQIIAGYLQSF